MLRSLFSVVSAAVLTAVLPFAGCGESGPRFAEDRLLAHVSTLASDEFGGRGPASPGEEKTVAYLSGVFEQLGLEPGNPDGTWVQAVPLVGSTAITMAASSDPGGDWEAGVGFVAWTKRVVPEVGASGELLFVGYGVQAPEYGWDDFGDADLTGKILVGAGERPARRTPLRRRRHDLLRPRTYKFEKAAAMGALGALIVHETGPAGYPWEVVSGSWTGEQFDLRTPGGNMDRLEVEGWISREQAVSLFSAAGMDFEEAREAATTPEFTPLPLGIFGERRPRKPRTARLTRTTWWRAFPEPKLPARRSSTPRTGSPRHRGGDGGDNIFNGAFDNATGTADCWGSPRRLRPRGPPPQRVVPRRDRRGAGTARVAPLCPEPALSGGRDGGGAQHGRLNVWGRTTDITVVGLGQSELDDIAGAVAAELSRELRPDPEPETATTTGSDHFEFAKVGIPAFYPDGGVDFIGKPEGFGMEVRATYVAEAYHKPGDEVEDWYDLSGMVDDLEFLYRMGRGLADSDEWPEWSETSEFRAAREVDRP